MEEWADHHKPEENPPGGTRLRRVSVKEGTVVVVAGGDAASFSPFVAE